MLNNMYWRGNARTSRQTIMRVHDAVATRGRMVWGRRHRRKDPDTGRSTRRNARQDELQCHDRPDLRIVDDELWQRVQQRLKASAMPLRAPNSFKAEPFWEKRRPKHLLTKKVFCGSCGRGLRVFGQDYLGCDAAYNGGCRNRTHVRRSTLEAQVIQVLQRQLMPPELVAECIAAFNTELKTLTARLSVEADQARRDLKVVRGKIAHLVDAISDGRGSSSIMTKLGELEAQEQSLAAKAAEVTELTLPPALHPANAEVYAKRVAALQNGLLDPDNRAALEAARALIDRVIVHRPETDGDPPGVEVIGELIELLKSSGVGVETAKGSDAPSDGVLNLFARSVKEGPGARPLVGVEGATPPRLACLPPSPIPRHAPGCGA